jgi:uncharacterized DUF497 family protein
VGEKAALVNVLVTWDQDDPEGNLAHVGRHGITPEEVEDVLSEPENDTVLSRSTGRLITFGWTRSGRHVAVVWEEVCDDPRTVYPVTAYETGHPDRG